MFAFVVGGLAFCLCITSCVLWGLGLHFFVMLSLSGYGYLFLLRLIAWVFLLIICSGLYFRLGYCGFPWACLIVFAPI